MRTIRMPKKNLCRAEELCLESLEEQGGSLEDLAKIPPRICFFLLRQAIVLAAGNLPHTVWFVYPKSGKTRTAIFIKQGKTLLSR